MAARTSVPNQRQQEQTRAAIKTSQLINRLQDFALAEKEIEIDTARIKAIEILLRKSLPDLASVDVNAQGGITITMRKDDVGL